LVPGFSDRKNVCLTPVREPGVSRLKIVMNKRSGVFDV
jgi:hypothetical protein